MCREVHSILATTNPSAVRHPTDPTQVAVDRLASAVCTRARHYPAQVAWPHLATSCARADAEQAKHELDAQRERNRRERECAKQVQYALGKLHSNVSADDVVKVVQVINQAHA